MNEETKRTLIVVFGLSITILLSVYIYTQNTGMNACIKASDRSLIQMWEKQVENGLMTQEEYKQRYRDIKRNPAISYAITNNNCR